MISNLISVEHKLEEGVHLDRILGQNQFSVILNGKLFKSEEAEVSEHLVHHEVISVGSDRMSFEKDCGENLKEFLITDASVKYLFDKNFLIGILHGS